ncbi:MAG: XRE family transcriptional regulator [Alcaligenaceae bacterium]|nr:XRE family transcriptional regulator [Alcaligenaceae bacterium]
MSIKLKLLRLQAGMTLEDIARKTNLTRSYVSKLERGISSPSIGVALRIAQALNVKVEELFAASQQDDPIVIKRKQAGKDAGDAAPRIISGALPGHRMVAFVLTPTDAPMQNHPMSHHNGEELLFVLKGSINLQIAQRHELLLEGDSAHFNASIPHKITSHGEQPASVLLVTVSEEKEV